jgi:hypothetical protein
MDMPVGDATVEVTLARAEEEHHEAEEPSSHDGMAETHTSEPAPNHGATAHEEMDGFLLEPSHHEKGEYSGVIQVESTGDWTITIHLTVREEEMAADFPLMIKSSSKNVILASFAGVNVLILVAAAALKRKPASK